MEFRRKRYLELRLKHNAVSTEHKEISRQNDILSEDHDAQVRLKEKFISQNQRLLMQLKSLNSVNAAIKKGSVELRLESETTKRQLENQTKIANELSVGITSLIRRMEAVNKNYLESTSSLRERCRVLSKQLIDATSNVDALKSQLGFVSSTLEERRQRSVFHETQWKVERRKLHSALDKIRLDNSIKSGELISLQKTLLLREGEIDKVYDLQYSFLTKLIDDDHIAVRALASISSIIDSEYLSEKVAKLRANRLIRIGIFDPQWYLSANPDVLEAGLDPRVHYIRFGHKERRMPIDASYA